MLAPSSGGNVQVFRRRGSGELTPLGLEQVTGLPSLECAGIDPGGKLLVVAGGDAQTVATFSVNPHSGHLTPRASRSDPFSNLDGIAFVQI